MNKIFQIGFNKCATRTIHFLLEENGIKCVHWHGGEIAKTLFDNKKNGKELLAGGYRRFQAFTDMEYLEEQKYVAIDLFKDLYVAYPGSVFIFNDRDVNAWIESRIKHHDYARITMTCLGISDLDHLRHFWKEQYVNHKKNVFEFFEDKEGLIYLNIDEPGWEEKFCTDMTEAGFPISPRSLHVGKTKKDQGL